MTEIDTLCNNEFEVYNYVVSLNGTIESITEKLATEGIFEKYRNIHKNYLNLYLRIGDEEVKIEILKRLIFLNWYSMLEPSCFTGIDDLDPRTVFESYSILDHYLFSGKIDAEFKWMLSYYSSWDYTILEFSENKLEALTDFVKKVDTSILSFPKNQLPKGAMDRRGQMGIYWISCSIEK